LAVKKPISILADYFSLISGFHNTLAIIPLKICAHEMHSKAQANTDWTTDPNTCSMYTVST